MFKIRATIWNNFFLDFKTSYFVGFFHLTRYLNTFNNHLYIKLLFLYLTMIAFTHPLTSTCNFFPSNTHFFSKQLLNEEASRQSQMCGVQITTAFQNFAIVYCLLSNNFTSYFKTGKFFFSTLIFLTLSFIFDVDHFP